MDEIQSDAEGIALRVSPAGLSHAVEHEIRRSILVGTVRLPLGGPYAPVARLYLLPDGRQLWHVRLWEHDRAVPHVVGSATVRAFARRNGLASLEADIERLVRAAEARRGPGAPPR